MLTVTKDMKAALEKECKDRQLTGVPELIRTIISDHFRNTVPLRLRKPGN